MTRTGQYRSWISAIHKNGAIRTLALGMLLAAALGVMTTAQAQTYTILYSFKGAPIPDAASPQGDLIRDTKGNLYGTTAQGGTAGAGAIFKLDPLGNESVLYNFTGGADGGKPQAGLLQASGGFYGTTYSGGAFGQGVVFKLKGTVETVLHSFGGSGRFSPHCRTDP